MILPEESSGAKQGAKFALGQVFTTGPILQKLSKAEIYAALSRHSLCDWGEVLKEDWQANDRAFIEGTRLLSAYRSKGGLKFWIITEADRSSTTVLFPEEY